MKLLDAVLDLLFPPKCIFCGKLLRRPGDAACPNCRADLPENSHPKPVRFTEGCDAPLRYEGVVRSSLLRFKFGGRPFYAAVYGPMLAGCVTLRDADLVTFVPVSRLRRFSRGYDQAELLARETAKTLGLPCAPTLTHRHTKRQSRMRDAAARRANVSGAFSLRPGTDVAGKRILLIDDICTTGATMAEAARVLRTAGAECVRGAVLAVTDETKNSR